VRHVRNTPPVGGIHGGEGSKPMTDAFTSLEPDLPWLRRLATQLARGDPDEAEDLVQETLHTAWRRAPTEEVLATPRGWLRTVMRNHLRMARRSDARRTRRHDLASAPAQASADPVDELARIELIGHVVTHLQALPELDQRIIALRFFDELDASAIGERLSMPPAEGSGPVDDG
jgi:RNA polymerase sigma factor (sigma-70 family)